MEKLQIERGRAIEAVVYPILLVSLMWVVFFLDKTFQLDLYEYGVKPHSIKGLIGIIFMPFIHSQEGYAHIINNSIPTLVLVYTLIYFYREVAFPVLLLVWLGTGLSIWFIAAESNSYHIGMSGVIYGLFGFILLSGFIKKYLPLQAISFIIAFVYGSMVWGILPLEEGVSWEGHFSGLVIGFFLAFVFRKKGPVRPKYAYEIEEELGIEPPNFNQLFNSNEEPKSTHNSSSFSLNDTTPTYSYKPKEKKEK